MNHKLRGFTLTELMVVLILSSLLIGFISVSFYHVMQYHNLLKARASIANDIWKLEYIITRDMIESHLKDADEERLLFLNADQQMEYRFDSSGIILVRNDFESNIQVPVVLIFDQDSKYSNISMEIINHDKPIFVNVKKRRDAVDLVSQKDENY